MADHLEEQACPLDRPQGHKHCAAECPSVATAKTEDFGQTAAALTPAVALAGPLAGS